MLRSNSSLFLVKLLFKSFPNVVKRHKLPMINTAPQAPMLKVIISKLFSDM